MLIPQFSLRWLLGLTTACAAIFPIFAMAIRGNAWAAGVSIALLSLVLAGLVYGALFAAVWLFSCLTPSLARPTRGAGRTPFASQPVGPPASAGGGESPAAPILLE